MARFNTIFTVNGTTQTITLASGGKIRAKSKHYFYAVFNFGQNDPFLELDYLSAAFSPVPFERSRNGAYIVPIENNNGSYECEIPWEVLTRKGKVYVGVFAGDMLVTNEAEIEITHAAPVLGADTQPTQSWWAKFSAALATIAAAVAGKQDKLTAGNNITITEQNVISATGGSAIQPYDDTPAMDEPLGGWSGESDLYARGDHQHPSDDSKADKQNVVVFTERSGYWDTDMSFDDFVHCVNECYNGEKMFTAHLETSQTIGWAVDLPSFEVIEEGTSWVFVFSTVRTDGTATDFSSNKQQAYELRVTHPNNVLRGELAIVELATAASVSTKYTKPASGIPASDLASGVIPTPLIGQATDSTAADYVTPAQVIEALGAGKAVFVTKAYIDPDTSVEYGDMTFADWSLLEDQMGTAVIATLIMHYNGSCFTYVLMGEGTTWNLTLVSIRPTPEAATAAPSDLAAAAAVGTSAKYAREDHVHKKPSASDIGALPSNTTFVSSVNGQSGAVTITAAGIGAATAPKYTTLTLAVADWESSGNAYACSKTVTGMTATSIVWLEYSDTETEFTEAQSANTLTFTVDSLPSAAITVNVAFMEGSALA